MKKIVDSTTIEGLLELSKDRDDGIDLLLMHLHEMGYTELILKFLKLKPSIPVYVFAQNKNHFDAICKKLGDDLNYVFVSGSHVLYGVKNKPYIGGVHRSSNLPDYDKIRDLMTFSDFYKIG